MVRAVLLGLLVTASVGACKSETNTAASQPGVAAGKVVEVKGSVTIKHGDATRSLMVGESVEGDDTVMTGADGNVVIELAHNLVRWELGPGKMQTVRESIAWKAAKSTGPAAHVDQDTAAAGRPAERSAVGTTTSEVEDKAAEEGAVAAAPPPPPAAAVAQAPAAAPADDAPAKPARTRTRRTRAPKSDDAAPRAEVAAAASFDSAPAPMEESAPVTRRGATRGPMVIAKTVSGDDTIGSAKSSAPGNGAIAPKAPPTGGSAITAKAAPPGPSASSLVAAKQTQLKACLAAHDHDADVRLILTVTGGKADVKLASKTAVAAGLEACVKKVIKSIPFMGDGAASATIKP